MIVIISPWSKTLKSGSENPKNYPYWETVVQKLINKGIKVIQIGKSGEKEIGANEVYFDLSPLDLVDLINKADLWVSVDNFLPHFCMSFSLKPGIVIFSKSDPEIFGYKHNTNLYKDRKYFRAHQYNAWDGEPFDIKSFISAEKLLTEIINNIKT